MFPTTLFQNNLINKRQSKSGKQLGQSFSSLQLLYNVLYRMGSSLDVDCQGCGSATITLGCIRCGAMDSCCSEVGVVRRIVL